MTKYKWTSIGGAPLHQVEEIKEYHALNRIDASETMGAFIIRILRERNRR